jgi:hypothetical protein
MPTIGADTLTDYKNKLALRGETSPLLEARLEWADAHQTLAHYLQHFVNCDTCGHTNEKHDLLKNRCTARMKTWEDPKPRPCVCPGYSRPERIHPHILPTQASGRWSTTNPPRTNFPEEIRNVNIPDPGWFWLCWDWSAIEYRMATAYGQDPQDVEALAKGWDIHSVAAWAIWPETKGQWLGKKDRRRHLAKVTNFTMIYGEDERALLQTREVEQLGADRQLLLKAGRVWLNTHPGLVSARRAFQDDCMKTRESRTFMGRRRRLFGEGHVVKKQGWSHCISGSVADMLDYCTIAILRDHPVGSQGRLVGGQHDAAEIAFPLHLWTPQEAKTALQPIVEKEWVIAGRPTRFPGDWRGIYEDGKAETL